MHLGLLLGRGLLEDKLLTLNVVEKHFFALIREHLLVSQQDGLSRLRPVNLELALKLEFLSLLFPLENLLLQLAREFFKVDLFFGFLFLLCFLRLLSFLLFFPLALFLFNSGFYLLLNIFFCLSLPLILPFRLFLHIAAFVRLNVCWYLVITEVEEKASRLFCRLGWCWGSCCTRVSAKVKETDSVGCIRLLLFAIFHDILPVLGRNLDNLVGWLLVDFLAFFFIAIISSHKLILPGSEHFKSALLRQRQGFFLFAAFGRLYDLELSRVAWIKSLGLVHSLLSDLLSLSC